LGINKTQKPANQHINNTLLDRQDLPFLIEDDKNEIKIADTSIAKTIYEMINDLDEEIKACQKDPARNFEVTNGKLLFSSDDGNLYNFKSDVALPIQPETPIRLLVEGVIPISGIIVAVHDFSVVLNLTDYQEDEIPIAKVSAEPWFIFELLKGRLEGALDYKASKGRIAYYIIEKDLNCVGTEIPVSIQTKKDIIEQLKPNLHPNDAQTEALSKCLGSNLHFVWGPPGTGKTANLAQVVRGLVNKGEKVLVLAHANAAVDVAMLSIAEVLASTETIVSGKVLRVGVPQLAEAQVLEEILPDRILMQKQPDLIKNKKRLEERRLQLSKLLQNDKLDNQRETAKELAHVRNELIEIKEALREAYTQIIESAQVIGATLSRLVIDDSIWKWGADAILIDETSMASFPFIFAAAINAKSRLLLFGDFRQLPPIYRANINYKYNWWGKDAFEVSGITENMDKMNSDTRVTLLNTQYRMAPAISDLVSQFAYQGRIKDGYESDESFTRIAEYGIEPKSAIVLVNTEPLNTACFIEPKIGSYSRINPMHALLAISIANICAIDGAESVGIITPYRAQANLIVAASQNPENKQNITAATVHRFQGSERDVVIFDFVDAPLVKGASKLTGNSVHNSSRLINVALSRPKGKLIVLADCSFINEKHSRLSPARKAIELLSEKGTLKTLNPRDFVSFNNNYLKWFSSWRDAQLVLAKDLNKYRGTIWSNLPANFQPSNDLISVYNECSKTGERIIVFANKKIINAFEDIEQIAGEDLRLENRPGGFFTIIGEEIAYIGGLSPNGPVARIEWSYLIKKLKDYSLGKSLVQRGPNANIEDKITKLCGHCPECGNDRRPKQFNDLWYLCCADFNHSKIKLDIQKLNDIAGAIEVACLECGGPVIAREKGNSLFLGCQRFGKGCNGKPPRMQDLFGGE